MAASAGSTEASAEMLEELGLVALTIAPNFGLPPSSRALPTIPTFSNLFDSRDFALTRN